MAGSKVGSSEWAGALERTHVAVMAEKVVSNFMKDKYELVLIDCLEAV